MAKLKWTVDFEVEEEWVADGFDITDQRALDMLSQDLAYANINTEMSAKVTAAPTAWQVAKLQGYKDTKEVERVREEGRLG